MFVEQVAQFLPRRRKNKLLSTVSIIAIDDVNRAKAKA